MASAESAYKAMHRRLDAMKLPAKYHACAWCGLTAEQWSYLRNSDSEQSGYGRNGVLRVWAEDSRCYVPQCRSCHRKFDQAYRRVGREGLADAVAPLREAAYAAVSDERRAAEAKAREASKAVALRFLEAQDKGLGSRYGRQPIEAERATHALLARAYAQGPSGISPEDMRAAWIRWSGDR